MSATNVPLVSVIVPTKNSAKLLVDFLNSLTKSEFQDFEVIINDDVTSADTTPDLLKRYEKELTVVYLRKNISMAQGRSSAARTARGNILIHLDSDMQVTPGLIGECVDALQLKGFDAVTIPEVSIGQSFWAKVKALEKACYQGVSQLESARAYKREVYNSLGGHDDAMVFSEDKDLDIRLRAAGFKVGRATSHLVHNEGNIKLFSTLKKKLGYSNTSNLFAEKHPQHYRWQRNPFNRYSKFVRNYRFLFQHPLLYISLYILKFFEYFFSFIGVVRLSLTKKARV